MRKEMSMNMVGQNCLESPKAEVGEIDTSSPFSCVKDAVSLFGQVSLSGDKTPSPGTKARAQSAEMAFIKVTQLHLADRQVSKLKKQLSSCESSKAEAIVELDKAKTTLQDLTLRLKAARQSKDSAAEAANNKLKHLEEQNPINQRYKGDMEAAREGYTVAITELNDAKQIVTQARQCFDAALEAKAAALRHAEEAQATAEANAEKARELSKEISVVRESIGMVKAASLEAQEGQARIFAEKDAQKQSYEATLEARTKKLVDLKSESECGPQNLRAQVAETESQICSVRAQMENVKASDLDSLSAMESQLDGAKESLRGVAEEERSLRSLVDARKEELDRVKKEHSEFMKKESETEFIAGGLNAKLQRSRCELEACAEQEAKARGAWDDMAQMCLEREGAHREAEEMLSKARELKREAESSRALLGEHEKKLRAARGEAREARAAEAKAVGEIKGLSETASAARASTAHSITITRHEYESLSRKVEESGMLAEMKVSAAMAQVEAVKASEHESANKVEASEKETEEVRAATESALRKADMAEAAKTAVEGELGRWRREREQKQQVPPHKLAKAKTSVPKKSVMRNLSGMFRRRKSHSVSVGGSPSYPSSYLPDHPTNL